MSVYVSLAGQELQDLQLFVQGQVSASFRLRMSTCKEGTAFLSQTSIIMSQHEY